MDKITRVVVTSYNANESTIISDKILQEFPPYEQYPCFQLTNLFYTEDMPQSLDKTRHLDSPYDINLPEGAMRILKMRMPTKKEMIADLQRLEMPIPNDWTNFNLHSTASIDYIYVLSGKITCVVGDRLLQLEEGNFLVQIGPEHTWINDNDEPCYMLCIMSGVKPNGQEKSMII